MERDEDENEGTPEGPESAAPVVVNIHPEEPERPEEPEDETPQGFSHASGRSDSEFRRLVMDNQRLAMDRLNQLSRLLEAQAAQMRTVMDEMGETMQLAQEMIGRIDESIERSGQQTAALVKVTQAQQEVLAALQTAKPR